MVTTQRVGTRASTRRVTTRTSIDDAITVVSSRVPDDLTAGPRFAAFAERYTTHTKGRWAGRPVIWESWQREFWWEALEINPVTGLRVYSEVGLGLPTKNGKSVGASVSGLYGLVADGEPEPEVYVAAAARGQAGIVLGQARSMALRSRRLWPHVQVQAHRLLCPANGGIMRALSSDAALQHGINPSWNVIDELHAHRTPDLYTVLTKSVAAREQPFTFWISTAGGDGTGILAEQYDMMTNGPGELEVRDGLRIYRDRRNGVLIYWFGAERTEDPHDPAVWMKVNPASWLQDGKWLTRQHANLINRGELLQWKMYHLNMFVSHEESWLPDNGWGEAGRVVFDATKPLGVGVFKTADSTHAAIAMSQRQGQNVVSRVEWFRPTSETSRVNTEAMRMFLRRLRTEYPVPAAINPKTKQRIRGPAFAFDQWAFSESAETLDQEGLNMVDFPQYSSTMGPASTQAYELITTGRLIHDDDPALREHVEVTTAILTDRGMKVVPNRKDGQRPNHGCIALIMSIAMAMQELPVAPPDNRRAVGW